MIILKRPAFSLIEVLLVVALLAITFAGIMALTQRILQLENVVRNDYIAEGLLKEGVELAAAMRDENLSSGFQFYKDLVPNCAAGNLGVQTFVVDWRGIDLVGAVRNSNFYSTGLSSLSDSKARVKYSTAYNYQKFDGADTVFYRSFDAFCMQEDSLSGGRFFIKVDVRLYWEERGKGHFSHAVTKLYAQ
jgi:prepilin-type N-terminal cleavage/methylation domain-containing protein